MKNFLTSLRRFFQRKKTTNPETSKTNQMKRPVLIFWRIFLGGIALFFLVIAMIYMGVFGKLPSLSELENPTILQASEVYAEERSEERRVGKECRSRRAP